MSVFVVQIAISPKFGQKSVGAIMCCLATSYDAVRRRGKMETHVLTEGSTENARCPENVEKVQRRGGSGEHKNLKCGLI